jgi:hypothetical protein
MWLAMDIGCIECGESSEVIGVYLTEEEANLACINWRTGGKWGRSGRRGEHSEEVFKIQVFEASDSEDSEPMQLSFDFEKDINA